MDTAQRPARTLSIADASFVIVGIVIGAGVFKTPALVAAHSTSDAIVLLLWGVGGAVALIGALCYAELASTYPSTGGDYHFLRRAFGANTAFLFGWARLAIMQTGSIALLAFVFGDYATKLLPLGPQSPALYAGLAILVLTATNLIGIREGKGTQRVFTLLEVGGLLAITFACLWLADDASVAAAVAERSAETQTSAPSASLGLAMVFVLVIYGGWNEG